MFKLLELELKNHKFLGNLELNFVDEQEESNGPYSTVIIGPNGTGKSEILRIIVDIFRELDELLQLYPDSYPFYPDYSKINRYVNSSYKIKFTLDRKQYLFTNIPEYRNKNFLEKIKDAVDGSDIRGFTHSYPAKVIATSILLNDRFPMVKSKESDLYQYMGIRRSPQVAGTRDYIKKIVSDFGKIADKPNFKKQILQMLNFLGYNEKFWISYYPRRKHIFFNGNLTVDKFHYYFNNWNESGRKTEPWSIPYYNKMKDSKSLILELVDFINLITSNKQKVSTRSWAYYYNILEKNTDIKNNFRLLDHLRRLDIVSHPGIELEKDKNFDIENTSSGEYHFLLSFLGILSRIENNSLILLDEPDISLHPNWQMKYVNSLKQIFSDYASCHFVITTHSHFIVSDLEPATSSIIALTRNQDNSISSREVTKNTYGWSTEEILYSVFNVKSTRNSYLEYDLTKLLSLINKSSTDLSEINRILQKLHHLKLSEGDPLNIIIEKTEKYLEDFNA